MELFKHRYDFLSLSFNELSTDLKLTEPEQAKSNSEMRGKTHISAC